jgi:hypothetical protein
MRITYAIKKQIKKSILKRKKEIEEIIESSEENKNLNFTLMRELIRDKLLKSKENYPLLPKKYIPLVDYGFGWSYAYEALKNQFLNINDKDYINVFFILKNGETIKTKIFKELDWDNKIYKYISNDFFFNDYGIHEKNIKTIKIFFNDGEIEELNCQKFLDKMWFDIANCDN